MKSIPNINSTESAYIPHVGWLRHELGEEVINLLRQGYFEASEQAFYWLYLRPGDTFIDCGAHIGLYSVIANRVTGGATRIIAIEPNVATAVHLEFNLKQNGVKDVLIIRSAVWMSAGQIRFIDEGEGKAAYARISFDEEGVAGASVPTITLDEIVTSAGAKEIALVKIDVEGAEPEALAGGQRAIEKGMLPVLMVEFTEHNLRRRGLATEKLVKQLEDLDYTLCEFSPESLELTRFSSEGPIWYKNLFACLDLDQVNARLWSARDSNRAIARDILDRATACSRFKELEELDRYRDLASEAERFRQWAEQTERLLENERESGQQLRQWATNSEQLLGAQKKVSIQLRSWAEDAEARLAREQQVAADNRGWAERTEQLLGAEKKVSVQLRSWVEDAEARLAEERTHSAGIRTQQQTQLDKLNSEFKPLKVFAKRLSWLYKLFEKIRGCRD
jgi:FkbM family methyltransferase